MGVETDWMEVLMDRAKDIRAEYKFSEDEKMMPMALINADEMTIVAMQWKDNAEKYKMARAIGNMAKMQNAKSLSFVTDGRAAKRKPFAEYFKIPDDISFESYHALYNQILRDHGGELKCLPRDLWTDILIVMTNGPTVPLIVQTQAYVEGENDTVKFTEMTTARHMKSDLLTDWWK